jgi:hypothetical protein
MKKPSGIFSGLLAAAMALAIVVMGWFWSNEDQFPPNSLPWKPMTLDAPPRWLAHWQINRLKWDARLCRDTLKTASKLEAMPLADRQMGGECRFDNVVRATSSPITFTPRVTATCAVTAALYWYQGELAQAASEHMGSTITGITQLGTYACRNVNNAKKGRLSQHATANAIDIAGFQFANGKRVSVLRDFGKDTPEGRFLEAAHGRACGVFNVVLGPRYNKQHADHFHLDMGGFLMCR